MNASPITRLAARALRAGGPDVLDVSAEDVPPPAEGQALIRVEAAGLNHVDTLARSGTYSIRLSFPYAVGIEGAGTVVAVGSGVSIGVGARVCWTAVFGSCATYAIAPAHLLALLPDDLSFEAGASLAHAGVAAGGLVRHCPLTQGSRAVVWGAAGAVGRLLVALLADAGMSVIGIATGSRVEAVRRVGAEYAIDRSREDVAQAVRDITRAQGAAAVFDPIGAETYETSLKLLAPRGYLVNYGQLCGKLPTIHLETLMESGSVFVTKFGPRAGLMAPHRIASFISEALSLALTRPVASDIAARCPLDRVGDAYRTLERSPGGKVLVLPHIDNQSSRWRSADPRG
jgi:NADPH:quinone reductase